MLLAFESVARTASACLCDDAGGLITECDSGFQEAEEVLVGMLDGLIRAHGLPKRLAVACGPGSFTGLRVAVTAARTLAYLEGLPVHGVDALTARALQEGEGLWWVLMSLKRDTTFHALIEVSGGHPRIVTPVTASRDDLPPPLTPEHVRATAIGPLLDAKPGLLPRWSPRTVLGSSAPLRARGVAAAAREVPAVAWSQLLPQYHQEPAPVLQRREQDAARSAAAAIAAPSPSPSTSASGVDRPKAT
jgi:tRNA threonylcarbamoyl adenosine modification protein YeaZ